jgi:succinate dehydrogenase/fumarate reductase-like Fe-S protein
MAQKMDLAKELDTRLTRQALYHFDVCTRCNACSDRCHMYVETEDPIHSPAYKLALLRRAYERYQVQCLNVHGVEDVRPIVLLV